MPDPGGIDLLEDLAGAGVHDNTGHAVSSGKIGGAQNRQQGSCEQKPSHPSPPVTAPAHARSSPPNPALFEGRECKSGGRQRKATESPAFETSVAASVRRKFAQSLQRINA
ncbi:hypothetical protein FRZ61_21010 [Hypericibacter adhaerens]|uniref:Uncharacterized protein n=1 Tax=Hypericibacter adhaerens TaxID=2602016 RepID=A0A5J6MXW8_9PROT|nr:hypothetical protein FRZ61_21010 [Hypericibacter adhaerens]